MDPFLMVPGCGTVALQETDLKSGPCMGPATGLRSKNFSQELSTLIPISPPYLRTTLIGKKDYSPER